MFKTVLSKPAEKAFLKLGSHEQKKISKAIGKLINNPLSGEKLQGELQGYYKLYAWPYRVIYSLNFADKIILIVTIGHRQGVYK